MSLSSFITLGRSGLRGRGAKEKAPRRRRSIAASPHSPSCGSPVLQKAMAPRSTPAILEAVALACSLHTSIAASARKSPS
jgi:hypothetical protein